MKYTAAHLGLGFAAWCAALAMAGPAQAGVPECGDIRLEDARRCQLRGDLECTAGCDQLGVYEKACATELQTVCSEECTFTAEAGCTDECTETCTESCDRGENVICIHNCFGECTVNCDATCAEAEDPDRCYASCEANCDAECDDRCKPLVDGDCYKHCVECCGGTCTATANLDCQVTCQERSFERCEYELRADCSASCSGEGAIFCDDEFVLAGEAIPACAAALAKAGLAQLDVRLEGVASAVAEAGDGVAEVGARADAGLGCSASGGLSSESFHWAWLVWAVLVGLVLRRGRQRI